MRLWAYERVRVCKGEGVCERVRGCESERGHDFIGYYLLVCMCVCMYMCMNMCICLFCMHGYMNSFNHHCTNANICLVFSVAQNRAHERNIKVNRFTVTFTQGGQERGVGGASGHHADDCRAGWLL